MRQLKKMVKLRAVSFLKTSKITALGSSCLGRESPFLSSNLDRLLSHWKVGNQKYLFFYVFKSCENYVLRFTILKPKFRNPKIIGIFLKILRAVQNYKYLISFKNVCIPESFNTNISQHLFDYTITVANSQHQNTNSKGDFVLKNWF